MRAVRQQTAGGPDVLRLAELAPPVPGPTEVLVKVAAAGVNPTDAKTRARGRFPVGAELPFVLGFDVAGTVAALGDGVTVYQVGDAVCGMPRFPHPAAAYAEFVTAPARHLVPMPDAMGVVPAAGLPLAGLTAWQALVDTAGVGPGSRVLVHAGAGGVGHLAVQIAHALGAHVTATSSAPKHAFLTDLGADAVVDRHAPLRETQAAAEFDAVLDPVGGAATAVSVDLLRRGGTLVRLPPWTAEDAEARSRAAAAGVRAVRMLVEPDRHGLLALTDLVRAGRLRVEIDGVYALADAAAAHRRIETGRVTGKVVLDVAAA